MIDTPAERPMAERLSPVRCGRCNWPVTHMNKTVPGAESGGMCTRCDKGPPFTYYGVVAVPCQNPCCRSTT